MLKKHLKVISVILCVCLILGTGAILFVKAGRKIAATPKRELFLCVKDNNILFESLKNADVYFEYDMKANKIKKHNKQISECIMPQYLNNTGEFFCADGNKYTITENGLLAENLKNDKITAIFEIDNRDALGYNELDLEYDFLNFKYHNEKLLFICRKVCKSNKYTNNTATKYYFCIYNSKTNTLYTTHTNQNNAYMIFDNKLYYPFDSTIMVYDETVSNFMLSINFEIKDNHSFAGFLVNKHGVVIISRSNSEDETAYTLDLYSYEGKLLRSVTMSENLRLPVITGENGIYISEKSNNSISLRKISPDLQQQSVVCNNLFPEELNNNWVRADNIVEVNNELYYMVTSSSHNDDGLALCRVDESGNPQIIYRERKHFLRNFFKSNFR